MSLGNCRSEECEHLNHRVWQLKMQLNLLVLSDRLRLAPINDANGTFWESRHFIRETQSKRSNQTTRKPSCFKTCMLLWPRSESLFSESWWKKLDISDWRCDYTEPCAALRWFLMEQIWILHGWRQVNYEAVQTLLSIQSVFVHFLIYEPARLVNVSSPQQLN